MMTWPSGLRLLAVLGAVLWSIPASAFDREGFQSCMSLAEASRVAQQAGKPLIDLKDASGEMYSVGSPAGAGTILVFSKGRLNSMTSPMQGGIDAFASVTKDLIQTFGQPRIEVRSHYTQSGLFSSISMTWTTHGGEEISAALVKYDGSVSASTMAWVGKAACR